MVLDLTRARVWVADASRRVYWDGTVEEYCGAARATMVALEDQVAELLKSLPPEQREQAAQSLKQQTARFTPAGGPAPRVTVERTDQTETIAGLPTHKYRVLADGKLYEELWLTTDAALLHELDLGRAADTFGRMFACLAGAGVERVEATGEYRQLFARGWPLRAVHHAEGQATARTLVRRIEPREIRESDLAPPAGFRAAPLTEVFARRR
jgi:hypothetical protein